MISALWSDPTDLTAVLADSARAVDALIDRVLALPEGPEQQVVEAMRYAALAPGKRLRPFLVLATANLFSVATQAALHTAVAVELIHAYSLVHDDLPAMDDSDLRRGRPTCHKAFDEATAILAGDGLLTMAFEILAMADTHSDPAVRIDLVAGLAKAAGAAGMVGGQMIDLLAEHDPSLNIGEITRLQRLKTGALIAFSCEAGAILGKAAPEQHRALVGYAHDLGLAFQIADDLLDIEGTEQDVGKSVNRDAAAGKATFVTILGAEAARRQAQTLIGQAIEHLAPFDRSADLLRACARFVVERRS